MQKKQNNDFQFDKIDWIKVIDYLEGLESFNWYDVKRAIQKTSNVTVNINGPFHRLFNEFIEKLGDAVKKLDFKNGKQNFKFVSVEKAKIAVGGKKSVTTVTTKPVTKKAIPLVGIPRVGAGIGCYAREKSTPIKSTPTITDEEKVRGLIRDGRSYSALKYAIYLLAIYAKFDKKEIPSSNIIREITLLGGSMKTLYNRKKWINDLFERLGFNKIEITKCSSKSTWKIDGPNDVFDEYVRLVALYEKITGKKSENLDDYIMAKAETKAPKKKVVVTVAETPKEEKAKENDNYKNLMKELKAKEAKTLREPRTEKDQEIVWKKWLLLLASRNSMGASRSVANLISWIEKTRYYKISEDEAKGLYHELMVDSEKELKYDTTQHVSMTDKAWKHLSKFYSPTQFKETIIVKLPLSQEAVSATFPGLEFTYDDTTKSGMNIYTVGLNRSMECEIALKKLLRFVKITGKIYNTDHSWMVKRCLDILSREYASEKSKNVMILSLEQN